ncbi:plastocyanin/azurin family copper-binding protein [Acidovorax sp.]|uniref:cupredoxin domain-containing protein n=1 Tax=Acidovorax sp. TaxID=1872122 RepID=UPI00391F9FBD
MNTTNLIATIALLACATGVFSHEKSPHHAPKAAPMKEQKEWGIAGDVKDVRRTIAIRMTDDMRFTPSAITVHEGETVRLRAQNKGKVLHEIVIGTQAELAQHAEMMKKFPAMEHDEPYMAHVRAGGQGDVVWHFNRPGSFDFACLIPGHYQAGMTGTITVLPRKP